MQVKNLDYPLSLHKLWPPIWTCKLSFLASTSFQDCFGWDFIFYKVILIYVATYVYLLTFNNLHT